jgi:hypothetical protein
MKNKLNWFYAVFIQFVLFLIIFILLRNVTPDGIIFYQGMRVIEILAVLLFLFYIAKNKQLDYLTDKLTIIFASSILSYSFLMTLPVVLDRSITLHFLNHLYQSERDDLSGIQKNYVENFVYKHQAIEKRVKEQLEINNIKIEKNQISLTPKGIFMNKTFDFLCEVFKIKTTYNND